MKLNNITNALTCSAFAFMLLAGAQANAQEEGVEQTSNLNIEFIEPESYTDIRPSNESRSKYRKHVLSSVEEYFTEFAATLPAGQSLEVKVMDIDLAGDTRSPRIPVGSMMFEVRVMEDIYFPRIKFEYSLKDESGQVVKTDEVNLKDMTYLNRAGLIRRNRDAFPYERHMLEKWFEGTFDQGSNSAS